MIANHSPINLNIVLFLPRKYYLQRPTLDKPVLLRAERKELFTRCLRTVADPDQLLTKWFPGASISEIKQENFKQLYRRTFLYSAGAADETENEVDEALAEIENELGRKLKPGLGNATCIPATMDKVFMIHRPLFYYLLFIMPQDIFTHIAQNFRGYHYHRTSVSQCLRTFPPRPQVFFTRSKSPSEKISYWYTPHTSKTRAPVVFLHGLGIGLGSYGSFLKKLSKEQPKLFEEKVDDGTVGLIVVENLPVSGRMSPGALTSEEFCLEMQKILAHHQIDDFTLVAHSYGTALATQLLKYNPISSCISSVILTDPINILLMYQDFIYNLTRRTPNLANEREMFFVARDMDISYTLGRRFFWTENLIWKNDLITRPGRTEKDVPQERTVSVMLSGRDTVVDSRSIATYLANQSFPYPGNEEETQWLQKISADKPPTSTVWESHDSALRIFWLGDLDHGQIFTTPTALKTLMNDIWGEPDENPDEKPEETTNEKSDEKPET
ncbi:hypothetical protein BP5796_05729 [Coleophoma crateriformis]|uniref:AB hydrolase-1 domain-containing protein n=1 Tax=Coleophoma crateriformis TaxID=565419 RepID=A0A3D8RUY1_9HELO|nr:hypothetical protein BP5796_05729 [Coleophoma crateriformis]